jgi:alkylation response protein AidB-like acyl-CoA dehydrogenase
MSGLTTRGSAVAAGPSQFSAEEEGLLREAVAGIAARFGHDYFLRKSAEGGMAAELWDALAAGGFTGANISEEHGGAGLGLRALAAVTEEVAAAGCPLIMFIISPAIAGSILARHGNAAQKERWLRPIGEGTGKVAFAISEPDAGSNSHKIATTARREGDHYVLRGSKTFISGVDETSAVLVVVRTGTDDGHSRLSLLIVDADAPCLERHRIPMTVEAPERQFTLFFDDVEVPDDRLIGDDGEGLRAVLDGLTQSTSSSPRPALASVATRWRGRSATPVSATSGGFRSVLTRASPIPSPRPRSSLSRPG